MAKVLSQRAVDAAKPPKKGRATRADGLVPGQQLIVHSGGKKVYAIFPRLHGKQIKITIGDASLMKLAEARTKGRGILTEIAER